MPILVCDCGTEILIAPDVTAMDKAIKNHLKIHKQLTGKTLTEEQLVERILKKLCETDAH